MARRRAMQGAAAAAAAARPVDSPLLFLQHPAASAPITRSLPGSGCSHAAAARPVEPHLAGRGVQQRALRLGAAVSGARLLDQVNQGLAELGLDQGFPAALQGGRKCGLGGAGRPPSDCQRSTIEGMRGGACWCAQNGAAVEVHSLRRLLHQPDAREQLERLGLQLLPARHGGGSCCKPEGAMNGLRCGCRPARQPSGRAWEMQGACEPLRWGRRAIAAHPEIAISCDRPQLAPSPASLARTPTPRPPRSPSAPGRSQAAWRPRSLHAHPAPTRSCSPGDRAPPPPPLPAAAAGGAAWLCTRGCSTCLAAAAGRRS